MIIKKDAIYFDSFGGEHILNKKTKIIGNMNIIKNVYRMSAYNSIMCERFCIGFIDFLSKAKSC